MKNKSIDIIKNNTMLNMLGKKSAFMPDRDKISFVMKKLERLLLRGETENIDVAFGVLADEVEHALCFECGEKQGKACSMRSGKIMSAFMDVLPEIQTLLKEDIMFAYNGDPAAQTPIEVILCYPGLYAIFCQRVAHWFYENGLKILPRIMTEHAHSETGIDIHPGAEIGKGFFIDHGTGVVIGETCVIGEYVKIYQGVTLGAKSFELDDDGLPVKGIKRHPNVEDNVTIYAGATILGNITIGSRSVIGGNTWITKSVPAGSTVKM
ncbi:serine O-acetyltransferase [Parelusimicrobium proximum]|uniref:serine O-acetyltransferase EpsC n=1 Tax=Parelusimicrobium proximum TaxID=3228953 RepID=UPI003D16F0B5